MQSTNTTNTTNTNASIKDLIRNTYKDCINIAKSNGITLPFTPSFKILNDSKMESSLGITEYNEDNFKYDVTIKLNSLLKSDLTLLIEVIKHELAHVYEFYMNGYSSHHGVEFSHYCNMFNIPNKTHYDIAI